MEGLVQRNHCDEEGMEVIGFEKGKAEAPKAKYLTRADGHLLACFDPLAIDGCTVD